MQHDIQADVTLRSIVAKEIAQFFSSPVAYLFLAAFSAATLFIFFWGEAFFARNIADVRPLFEWMPVLLVFLCATLSMRMWSEERRSGTLEYVLTRPVPLWHFVVGKFLACLFLLALALVITLPLPLTVSYIGDLDWGPVWAGYLATLLVGAAYLSIGLFVSARSDNQIVSLIAASVLCGAFYLVGSPMITSLVSNDSAEWLRLLGTGSRFDAITRGVIDVRDLYYYIALVLVFLALNTLMLERERWVAGGVRPAHRRWLAICALIVANAIAGGVWLAQLDFLRIDVTQGRQYTLSDATRSYLAQLQEPLLIRGYFSGKTHPLLAPLVPQMRDLIREYAVAGGGRVRVEFVDPLTDPAAEKEANEKFGIQPVPFQVADRYQSSIVSSYFNVLVQYGDEYQVLGFRDLIELKARGESDIDVQLRNPEHDLTSSVKKVLQAYQAGGNLFDTVKGTLEFKAYISPDERLPEQLVAFRQAMQTVLDETARDAAGRFRVQVVDPEAGQGEVARQIAQDYGFEPMAAGLFSDQSFYFYLTLAGAQQVIQIPLGDMTGSGFKRNLQAAIKRFASGFTRTVALVAPEPPYTPYGGGGGPRFAQLQSVLGAEMNVQQEDLSDGSVAGDADILVLAAPRDLNEKQLFAVDQFLMKGGTVVAATSPFTADLTGRSLALKKQHSGLEQWLQHNGLPIAEQVVLDPQNAAFPVPVTRNVAGLQLQDIRMLDYPYFIDVRGDGLDRQHPVTAELPQVTMAWASPIQPAEDAQGREITPLLRSSAQSWLSDTTDIMPKITERGITSFVPQGNRGRQLLGVVSQGRFDSWFAGKPSPLLDGAADADAGEDSAADSATATSPTGDTPDTTDDATLQIGSVISRSPESARIILFASNDFLRDQVVQLLGSAQQTEYLNSLQLLANAVDWSLEDAGLLSIRSRGHFNRTLPPMERADQEFWEYLNYALALATLIVIAVLQRFYRQRKQRRFVDWLAQ